MLHLERSITVGKERNYFAVYTCQALVGYEDVVGTGNNFTDAIESFLSQVPEKAYVDNGEDWDDPHEYIDTRDFELSNHIEVNFGECYSITR